MKRKNNEHDFAFSFLEIEHGDFLFRFSGNAFYEIVDAGNGFYEFHGKKGNDKFFTAEFFKVFISDWEILKWDDRQRFFEKGDVEEIGGMTENDRMHWETVIMDRLNDDFTLCQKLIPPEPPEPPELSNE